MSKQSIHLRGRINSFLAITLLFVMGCSAKSPDVKTLKQEEERKQHAEYARREMETLPKAFKTRDPFRVNEPASPTQEAGGETRKQ